VAEVGDWPAWVQAIGSIAVQADPQVTRCRRSAAPRNLREMLEQGHSRALEYRDLQNDAGAILGHQMSGRGVELMSSKGWSRTKCPDGKQSD
jgi:hypothetical protein